MKLEEVQDVAKVELRKLLDNHQDKVNQYGDQFSLSYQEDQNDWLVELGVYPQAEEKSENTYPHEWITLRIKEDKSVEVIQRYFPDLSK